MAAKNIKKVNTLDKWCDLEAAPRKKRLEETATASASPSSANSSNSDSTHKLGFRNAWKQGRSWLNFDGEKNAMLCTLCSKHKIKGQNGPLTWATSGCKTLCLDKVVEHEKSIYHVEAVQLEAGCKNRPIEAKVVVMQSKELQVVISALKVIYWLVKRHIPHTTNYESLVELVIELGCEELKNLIKSQQYTSEEIIQEFSSTISQVIEEDIKSDLKGSQTYSLMVDESKDVSVRKQLVIFGRMFVEGKVETRFLRITELFDGKAETIMKAIKDYLQSSDIDQQAMSGFGSDDASVMVGRRSGVATRLRETNASLINVHCICHWLALASKDAFSEISYLKKYEEILTSLFKFYHNSSMRSAGLREIQRVCEEPQLKLKEAKHVRYVGIFEIILQSLIYARLAKI